MSIGLSLRVFSRQSGGAGASRQAAEGLAARRGAALLRAFVEGRPPRRRAAPWRREDGGGADSARTQREDDPAARVPPAASRAVRGAAGGALRACAEQTPNPRGARRPPPPPPANERGGGGASGAAMAARGLERLFALFFLSHVPVTLLLDAQALGARLHPHALTELVEWYTTSFKDPLMAQRPAWFKSFIYCEVFLQLPFFLVAVYAFWKGNCKWIRIPAIIYAAHVATTMVPILAHFLFHDFSDSKPAGPQTWHERLWLVSIYIPYLLIPILLLLTMLFNPSYNSVEKRKTT
uniref:sigma intracellular receptor 2 n=1 Tax=Euleptes europaea TaxID=460621 RepID=UPI002540600A|nr:sigma intracellular receptor 2 [Euleptes europaea]